MRSIREGPRRTRLFIHEGPRRNTFFLSTKGHEGERRTPFFVHEGPRRTAKNTFFLERPREVHGTKNIFFLSRNGHEGPRRTPFFVHEGKDRHLLFVHERPRRGTRTPFFVHERPREEHLFLSTKGRSFYPRKATKGNEEHLFLSTKKNTLFGWLSPQIVVVEHENQARNGPILPAGFLLLSHFQ